MSNSYRILSFRSLGSLILPLPSSQSRPLPPAVLCTRGLVGSPCDHCTSSLMALPAFSAIKFSHCLQNYREMRFPMSKPLHFPLSSYCYNYSSLWGGSMWTYATCHFTVFKMKICLLKSSYNWSLLAGIALFSVCVSRKFSI